MNPYLIAATIAATVAFGTAWTVQGWRYEAKDAERIAAETTVREAVVIQANTAATGHEGDKVKIQTKYVTITETVEKVIENSIYRADCFDPAGMRAHSDAVILTGATGQPDYTLPTPAPIK